MTMISNRQGLFTRTDLAEELELSYATLRYAIKSGTIPAPTYQMNNSSWRYYTTEEVEEIKKTFTKN